MEDKGENGDGTGIEKEVKSEPFKKPQFCLVGPRKSKGTKVRVVDSLNEVKEKEEQEIRVEAPTVSSTPVQLQSDAVESTNQSPEVSSVIESKSSKTTIKAPTPAQKLKETPIPYLEPKWGGLPSAAYSLDVIKSGTVLDPIDISSKSYFVFGRQTNCDIQMAHPTISRHHAVLQYSKGTEKPEGFYLYDLGSTHGTFLNKSRVRSEMFIRIKVGHQIKLGGSTRLYLLQGPPEDMEDESELTVTELKAKRQQEIQAKELAELAQKQKEEEEKKKREEEGIDWGMGDDADEETDLSENPYASTTNEDLYIDDPKKTLRGWFEREGHELEYDVEEKGPGQFLCRIEVPVEGARGGSMFAEALVKGKKKEAVAQCALEACRLLDRLGLLRQATHESRKRKAKNWEEEDFYDSDDDTFLDRTGAVEKKRQQRMRQAGKSNDQVETYQSLSGKHAEVLKKLESTQASLQKAQADLAALKKKNATDEDGDSLDSFMKNLSKSSSVDKRAISQLKSDLAALLKEESQLRKLVNIARPTSLPELLAPALPSENLTSTDKNALKNKLMLAARRKATEKKKIIVGTSSNSSNPPKDHVEDDDEVESEAKDVNNRMKQKECENEESQDKECSYTDTINRPTSMESFKPEETPLIGPAKPSFISVKNQSEEPMDTLFSKTPATHHIETSISDNSNNPDILGTFEEEDEGDEGKSLKDAEKRRKRNRRRQQQRNEKALERTKLQYDASDPNYSVWVPPEDQSGDGKTKLNEKLGY